MGKRKDKLMKEFLARDIQVGDKVYIPEKSIMPHRGTDNGQVLGEVRSLPDPSSDTPTYQVYVSNQIRSFAVSPENITRYDGNVGINPIPDMPWMKKLQHKMFDVFSIVSRLQLFNEFHREYLVGGIDVNRTNFNPFVIDKDNVKQYFQREYCWNLADCREFIKSWYQSCQCGTIIIRRRSFEWCVNEIKNGNPEASLYDVIDGKQRLHCLQSFLNDGFSDCYGNRWSDLSKEAQNALLDSQVMGYMELGESVTDFDTIQTFLTINNTGKVMSRGHINKVRAIADKLIQSDN